MGSADLHAVPSAMEPLLPTADRDRLREKAGEILRAGASLAGAVHPVTRGELARLLRLMNSYYSNRIEGQTTRPLDIERALARERIGDRAELAQLAVAHVEVQEELEARLAREPGMRVTSPELLRWIHAEVYRRVPSSLREVRTPSGESVQMEPGNLRTWEVVVGRHVAPAASSLSAFSIASPTRTTR